MFIGGHTINRDQLKAKNSFSHVNPHEEEIHERGDFDFEGVMGFSIGKRVNTYMFLNVGLINPNVYISMSIGI